MAITIEGFGSFLHRDVTNNEIYAVRPNAFTITEEQDTEPIQYYPSGGVSSLQTLATKDNGSAWSLSIESGWFSDQTFPFLFNQRPSTGNITVLRQQVSPIPAAGATQQVSVTGLTADQTNVRCTLIDNTSGDTYMTRVATATGAAATGEFDVEAGAINFDSSESDAGKSVLITWEAAETGLTYIGGPAPISKMGTIEFFGKAKASNSTSIWSIWCKEVEKNEGVEFGSAVDNIVTAYSMNTPSDWNLPFLLYKD